MAAAMEVMEALDGEAAGMETQSTWTSVDELTAFGLSMAEINKMKAAGQVTSRGVASTPTKELLKIKGFSEATVKKVKAAVKKQVPNLDFCAASQELQRREQQNFTVSTGSSELDKLIGGGVESQSIIEFHGEYRTGKSQICHTLCATAQLPNADTGYPGGRVVYIDTEGTFRPDRLLPIYERFGIDATAALENVYFVQALTSEHQAELLESLAGLLMDNENCIKVVIVDSIMALFRTDYHGRGELQARQFALGQYLRKLRELAEEFNFAVVLTNQMTSDPSGGGFSMVSDPKKPIGGHVLAHAVQTRVLCKKGAGSDRIAKLVDSTTMQEADCTYTITNGGITNA